MRDEAQPLGLGTARERAAAPAMLDSSNNMTSSDKDSLRQAALARRDALGVAERIGAARRLSELNLPIAVARGVIVSGFFPIRGEIDPMPLMHVLWDSGATLALPVVSGRDQPLAFRQWEPDAPLVRGSHGTREPIATAPEAVPDILLVPFAAFDREGHRIGYGAGYYDRTLERLRSMKPVIAIGVGFAVQEIERVPSSDHDARLDLVLTDKEVIDLRRPS